MTKTIGLAMIVKDAEDHVGRCIDSALPLLSYWTVIDTGSTDETEQIVQEKLGHLPGQLLHSEFLGFDHNRTELIRAARPHADYTLMLDADMELKYTTIPELVYDEYQMTIYDRGLEYGLPLLTTNEKDFFYAGVAHACLCTTESMTTECITKDMWIIDHGGGGNRPGKIERDRDKLKEQVESDPTDKRSWFYLAQSHRDLEEWSDAIRCYLTRASMGGWDEEVYFSWYQAGQICVEHVSFLTGAKYLLKAFEMRQSRSEALRALSNSAENVADKIPFPINDLLFVKRSAYRDPPPNDPAPPRPEKWLPSYPARKRPVTENDVSAIVVTRGDVDLAPILDSLPYDDVVVWDNSKREFDYKVFGRYMALYEVQNQIVYMQDDDILFTNHQSLLDRYKSGTIVANMDPDWIMACKYPPYMSLPGAGSLMDVYTPGIAFDRYLSQYPYDQLFLHECDFIVGSLSTNEIVDLGYGAREFADDASRMYKQSWQHGWKWEAINRCSQLR